MRRTIRLLVIGMLVLVPAAVAIGSVVMSASPDHVDFPTQCTHTAATGTPLVVTNDGPDTASEVTVAVSPSAMVSVFPLGGQTASSQLPSGGSLQVQVGFLPQHVGASSANAVVTFTDPGSQTFGPQAPPRPSHSSSPSPSPTGTPTTRTLEIPLSGNAIDRWIDVNPPGVNFGTVHTGKTAADKRITIFDDGATPLTIQSMYLGGRQPGDFTIVGAPSSVVTDGHPVTLTLGFKPKAAGARAAKLIINSNSCSGTFSVLLGGIAVEQDIAAAPKTVDFSNVEIGTNPVQQLAIVNQGGAPLTVKSIQMVSDDPTTDDVGSFTLTGIPKILPMLVKPGQPINLKVGFKPVDAVAKKVDIKVTSNDPDTPILTVPVTASAVAKPTPTPTDSALVSPPTKPAGGGFHLHLGPYVPTVVVAILVAGFFWVLVFARRRRGIPE